MLMIPDYFHYRLTGVKKQEYTNATTTQLVSPKTNTWDKELIQLLGYPEKWFTELSMPCLLYTSGKGHADLSADYSSVPNEMKKVAQFFGKEVCAEIKEQDVIDHLAELRAYAGDRSVPVSYTHLDVYKRQDMD